ncbi:510-methylenetetrahydromethanopterin reductase protein [Halorhabdus tiamatea SARL4B]|uniref:5,10-methylenetetrahydromethanopterin reductase n=1 Tax=Halorhabdus tiamatea SARL4B TaxID=1033806 RepID=F7PKA4_9EURY|nr:5,10-methylenetetrahydromethanopterin reductase [Halorhabdus tiamatea]ERJ07626.1 510-methylenetetrahydromethanopterin reductase protein [Halorhabdus tiamatea SARL4B]CCQ33422.1 5,10-methylenetetrahydromethanopterin reductase [Halorhabdus tiamatea SARL4B]
MKAIELTPEQPVETVRRLAERAERAGFDTIFASNHYNNRDPFQTLSSIAAGTETARLGPGVVNPYETHPVRLASRMATLDESSDGRGVFGIGAGDASTLANLGVERDSPLRRVLETFKVAQRLWAGETVDHDGQFVARDASLNYEVGEIPVYVGAQGPHMLRMSGKHADGVLVNAAHPADLSWSADRIAEGRAERPDDRGDFDIAAYASVSVAEDEDRAREAARPPVAFIVGSTAPPVLDRHDLDHDRAGRIGDAIERGDFETAFEAVTPAMIDAFAIAGSKATVADRIEAAMAYVDSFVVASPLGPDLETAIDLAAEALETATAE